MPTPMITAVLVLYQEHAETCACFRSLRDALMQDVALATRFHLVIYDNSPQPQAAPNFPAPLEYISDPSNGGIAAAYNAGLERARRNGSQWLQLLDQDTVVTLPFLQELSSILSEMPAHAVAAVPRLVQDGVTHSPSRLPRLSHRRLPEDVSGLLQDPVSVYNSGAVLRVSALERFPERYWLDFLDHAIFHELQAEGGRVWLLQARLPHQLSTENLGTAASLSRYLNVVQAERDFYREYGSRSDKIFYHLRRAKQALGQLWKVSDKRFALLSARAAFGLLPATPSRPTAHKA